MLKFYRENTEERNMVMITWSKTMRLITMLIAFVTLTACTACGVPHDVDKHFNFAPLAADVDPAIAQKIRYQIDNFNTLVGAQILTLAGPGHQYSSITVVKTIPLDGAIAEAKTGGHTETYLGGKLGSYTERDMDLTFSSDFFKEHEKDEELLDVVFYHEVGHGLEMEHSADKTDVMYEAVGVGTKDIPRFITACKAYLGLN